VRRAAAAALVLVLLTTACGGDAEPEDEAGPASEPSAAAPDAAGGGGDNVLIGAVGEPDDPDAFVITLTDSDGEPVETLPAGEYSIQVSDPSELHNFHLSGGDVDETTTVPGTDDATWTVDLQPGDYEAVCDPHPQMQLAFTVT
jgi:hypothetical protein